MSLAAFLPGLVPLAVALAIAGGYELLGSKGRHTRSVAVAVLVPGCGMELGAAACHHHARHDPACICIRWSDGQISHITSVNAACRAHDMPAEVSHG